MDTTAIVTDPMKTSDWVLTVSTIMLAIVALAAPVLTEWLKRRFWAPSLRLGFDLAKPDCHTTDSNVGGVPGVTVPTRPVHVYRFRVTNDGRSQARHCEAVVEGIGRRNAARELVWHDKYTPVSLVWGSGNGEFPDVNKDRTLFCDFLFIHHLDHQNFFKQYGTFVSWPNTNSSGLGLELRVSKSFNSQPNWLPQGEYRIKIAIFSDNAPVVRQQFDIAWSGNWAPNEDGMFQECVVRSA